MKEDEAKNWKDYLGKPLTKRERNDLLKVTREYHPEPITNADKVLAKELLRRADVPVHIDERAVRHGGGAFYYGAKDPFVVVHPELSKHTGLLAHELGHADFHKTIPGRLTQNVVGGVAYAALPLVASIAAIAPKEPKHKIFAAAASIALLSAPTLISEHRANAHGRKLLAKAHATEEQLAAFDKHVIPPLGSYYVMPIAAATMAAIYGTASHVAREVLTKSSAVRATLDSYGLSKVSGEDLGLVARGRTPFKPLDPAMQRLRDAQGVNMAFEDNAQIDPTNPNPEPGVMHRADA